MKILIAYDGSESADAALEDLKNAGLPKIADVMVLSIADVFIPPPIDDELDQMFPAHVPEGVPRAHMRAEYKLREAKLIAKRASDRLQESFPKWNVRHEAQADSPAWAIIRAADEWKPDLIVVGAHGHSVLGGRLILGSVSQRVLYEARSSVRIGRESRRKSGVPLRIIIAVDNSPNSNAAVNAVYQRKWPAGTEVRLLTVVDTVMAVPADPSEPTVMKWIEVEDESSWDRVREIFEPAADKLRSVGLLTVIEVRRGDPKDEVIREAQEWGAHSVFVGAKGARGIDRLLLGSVSSAVSARAHCSVEVVRSTE